MTNHGVIQAKRLGAHLAANAVTLGPIKYIFASDLQRAVKTAEAVAQAQIDVQGAQGVPEIVQLPMLREKDFGSEEGMRFGTRATFGIGASSNTPWIEPESRQSMKFRIDQFLDSCFLATVAQAATAAQPGSIAIVAHGIILNVLLRCLLTRFGPGQMLRFAKSGNAHSGSEWLASWSNTGYLVFEMRLSLAAELPAPACLLNPIEGSPSVAGPDGGPASESSQNPADALNTLPPLDIQLLVTSINCTDHLQGLKKTRSGIGSARFDEKQKTLDSFFSRAPPK